MSKKISEYTIVNGIELVQIVNNCIEQGWQPFGPPVLDEDGYLSQALVIYVDE